MSEATGSLPALQRLAEIDQIQASFVADAQGRIIAREVPGYHADASLTQVALRLWNVFKLLESKGTTGREARIEYDHYGIWIKPFADNEFILALFYDRNADISLLRQPINIAVLNLNKSLKKGSGVSEEEEGRIAELAAAAQAAETEIFRSEGEDSNGMFDRLCTLGYYYAGPISTEVYEHCLTKNEIQLPLTTESQVRTVGESLAEIISSVDAKQAYSNALDDMIVRAAVEGLEKGQQA